MAPPPPGIGIGIGVDKGGGRRLLQNLTAPVITLGVRVSGELTDGTDAVEFPALFYKGLVQSKPSYTATGLALTGSGTEYYCFWNSLFWNLLVMVDGVQLALWTSTDAVATPDLVTTWTETAPATGTPVVTRGGVGDPASVTNPGTYSIAGATFTYQWKRDGAVITGATSSTYTTTELDVAASLSCPVTATKGSQEVTTSSNSIDVVGFAQVACLGTSITNAISSASKTVGGTYGCQLVLASGRKWLLAENGLQADFGLSGGVAADGFANSIGATLSALVAATTEQDLVVVELGTNDYALIDPATSTYFTPAKVAENVIARWDDLRTAGRRVVGCEVAHVVGDATNRAETNVILAAAAAARGMLYCDWNTVLLPENAANYSDGLHPSYMGGTKMGSYLATKLAGLRKVVIPTLPIFSANPTAVGASGTYPPTGWINFGAPYQGANGGYSYVPATDDRGDWLECTLTQTSGDYASMSFGLTCASGFAAGDYLRTTAEIETETVSGAGLRIIDATCFCYVPGLTTVGAAHQSSSSARSAVIAAGYACPEVENGLIISPPFLVSDAHAGWLSQSMQLSVSISGAVKIRVRQLGFLKNSNP